jgi:hypothetical protein
MRIIFLPLTAKLFYSIMMKYLYLGREIHLRKSVMFDQPTEDQFQKRSTLNFTPR